MLMVNKSILYRERLKAFYESLLENNGDRQNEALPEGVSPEQSELAALIDGRANTPRREERFVELVAKIARESH